MLIEFSFKERKAILVYQKQIGTGELDFDEFMEEDENFRETLGYAMAVTPDEKHVLVGVNSDLRCYSFDLYENTREGFELKGSIAGKLIDIDSCFDLRFMGQFGQDLVFFGHDDNKLQLYVYGEGRSLRVLDDVVRPSLRIEGSVSSSAFLDGKLMITIDGKVKTVKLIVKD